MPIPERISPNSADSTAKAPYDPMQEARQRLIVALDVPDAKAAMELVDRLTPTCNWFKVGLELFVADGLRAIEMLTKRGNSVFLDLKFHDIPNTVAGALRSAAGLGVRMVNVHASGGPVMLAAAQEALAEFKNPPELLAVTVLTSMDQAQVSAAGIGRSPSEQVELLAGMCIEAGIRGFVCSPQEVATLRRLTGPEGTLVIPGIRPAGGEIGDQKRVATPAATLRAGASHLVVGRPITQAVDPQAAAVKILEEMAGALKIEKRSE